MLILRRLYSRRSNSARYLKPAKRDPGILHQKKLITETQEEVFEDDFEELESDFMSVHTSHREHVRQMDAWKEQQKYLIVKRKYFTEKFPNFLTWHDKEQIRYLHNVDPEEWTIEKLSEGFPALPDIIEKIVKGKWTKKNQTTIASHDRSVTQHWANFKQGKLNGLPGELKEHLHKFSNRSLNLNPFEIPENKDKVVKNMNDNIPPGEFSEIISSYQRLQNKNAKKDDVQNRDSKQKHFDANEKNNEFHEVTNLEHQTFKQDKRLLTFKELQHRVEKDLVRGKNVSEQDKLILNETKQPIDEGFNTTVALRPEQISHIVGYRRETNRDKVGFVKKTVKDMSHLIYPERILIPKEHYKRGYTYKLNDCYYASDGEFLYRVPGMS